MTSTDRMLAEILLTARRTEQRVVELYYLFRREMSQSDDAINALAAEVANNTTVEGSALTLIQGFGAQLAAAAGDPAKIQALQQTLANNDQNLAAAIAANTPAAPIPPPDATGTSVGGS